MISARLPGYELFLPPYEVDFEGWRRRQALEYFEWFKAQIFRRLAELRRLARRVGVQQELDLTRESVVPLGSLLLESVRTRPKTEAELEQQEEFVSRVDPRIRPYLGADGRTLDEDTLSLCIDVGIYLAEALRAAHPWLEWDVPRRGSKRNMPALAGFRDGDVLFPPGPPQALARGAIRGEASPSDLQSLFDTWSDKAEGRGPYALNNLR